MAYRILKTPTPYATPKDVKGFLRLAKSKVVCASQFYSEGNRQATARLISEAIERLEIVLHKLGRE